MVLTRLVSFYVTPDPSELYVARPHDSHSFNVDLEDRAALHKEIPHCML